MIEDHAVFYAPSLSVLREMKSKTSKFGFDKSSNPVATANGAAATPALLAFGDPISGDGKKQSVPSPNKKLTVGPTAKEKEVLALRQSYGANNSAVFLKEQASEKLFKSDAGRYNVIHLATEGNLDNRNPMNSYVEMAKSRGDTDGDGRLEVREMMNLNLRAELVVMSACDTARGRIGAGEGVISMSWALFVAGVPTAVVSQWRVESDSTSELMVSFHKHLLSRDSAGTLKVTKAEAMRRAASELINAPSYSHPFFWAGFSIIGDGTSVYQQPLRSTGSAPGLKAAK